MGIVLTNIRNIEIPLRLLIVLVNTLLLIIKMKIAGVLLYKLSNNFH